MSSSHFKRGSLKEEIVDDQHFSQFFSDVKIDTTFELVNRYHEVVPLFITYMSQCLTGKDELQELCCGGGGQIGLYKFGR